MPADNDISYLEVSNYSVETKGENFYIVGQIMSTELIPEDVLRADIGKLKGKELRLEHAIPEIEPYAFVGEVEDVWWDETKKAPFAKALVFGDSDVEKQLRKDLQEDQKKPVSERKYKGFSIGLINQRNKVTKKSIKIFPRELSITEEPVCKECTINSVMQFGEKNMSDAKVVEMYQAQLKEQKDALEKVKAEYGAGLETLTKKLAEKDKAISELNTATTKAIEDFNKKMAEREIELNSLREAKRLAENEPFVNTLLSVRQFAKDSEIYGKKRAEWLKMDKVVLNEFAEYAKGLVELYSQKFTVVGGSGGIPIETRPHVVDNGSGYVTMDEKTARKIL